MAAPPHYGFEIATFFVFIPIACLIAATYLAIKSKAKWALAVVFGVMLLTLTLTHQPYTPLPL